MSKYYSFFILSLIILTLSACGGSSTKDSDEKSKGIKLVSHENLPAMSAEEQLQYAENLLMQSKALPAKDRSASLSNALMLATNVLIREDSSPKRTDEIIALIQTINTEMQSTDLVREFSNQALLSQAAIFLKQNQAEQALTLLKPGFDSSLAYQVANFHHYRAIALYQKANKSAAIKELIIRHDYLTTPAERQHNQNQVWQIISSLNNYELEQLTIKPEQSISQGDRIYAGWFELSKIIRQSRDTQRMNHALNFWLQSHPDHHADRQFINQLIQARQKAILTLNQVAVLLPQKGKLSKPARAIRDGILASHYENPLSSGIEIRFYDTSEGHIWQHYQKAIEDGAEFIIGPLAKSNVEILTSSSKLIVPTLALNSLEDTVFAQQSKTGNLYQFGLSPEADARMVADKAHLDGHHFAAIMTPENNWGKRMASAFQEQWQKAGGVIVDSKHYNTSDHDFSKPIKAMMNIDQSEARKRTVSKTIGRKLEFTPRRRQDIDVMFMAAFPRQAKQIPLQVIYHHGETVPVYATSHIVGSYLDIKQNIDMDGVLFSDMPFLLGISKDAVSHQNTYQNTLYQRLFAMGVDSYQLAPYVDYLYQNKAETFAGDTGQLAINPGGHIIRSQPWAIFKQGNAVPQSDYLERPMNSQDNVSVY
jgi:outer membrane PBP1 activator LpoA protein